MQSALKFLLPVPIQRREAGIGGWCRLIDAFGIVVEATAPPK
jgi:hypothetical protein